MRNIRYLFAVGASAVVMGLTMSGCMPPELMQASEPMTDAADAAVDTAPDTTQGEVDVPEEASFAQVADIVRGSCASTPSCHGNQGFTNFQVQANADATDAEVREAIEGVTTLAGVDMVAPGDPDVSALYLRLVETGARKMPPAGQPELSAQQIETIRQWIEEGAAYE